MEAKLFFIDYLKNEPENINQYIEDCYNYIHGEAQRKGIEFDGYFQTKWENAADTISQFNEFYFENKNRKTLYVYLSALYDAEIYKLIVDAYEVAKLPIPTNSEIKIRIDNLIKSGTKF